MSNNRAECEHPHVTPMSAYTYGCRCDGCKQAKGECSQKYHQENREERLEHMREYSLEYYSNNRDAMLEKGRKWREDNPNYMSEYSRQWQQANPDKCNATCARRRARKLAQMHPGRDTEAIKALYAEARRQAEITGEEHHVDHIIPLSKGGWHHEYNMQVITAEENWGKNDSMPDESFAMAIREALETYHGRAA